MSIKSIQQRKAMVLCAVLASFAFLYYSDAACLFRGGQITLTSHGEEITAPLAVRNGCRVHHLSSDGGIHVVGIGRTDIDSVHVGYLEDFNRIERLKQVDAHLTDMAKKYRFVGIVTNGGTHHKPALARVRDDVAIEVLNGEAGKAGQAGDFSLVAFFKKYDLGKLLSVEHGCCTGYLMMYDVVMRKKVMEKIGLVGATVPARL